ncbi:hypothetical protein PR048_014974 [Dryococelus australis]|uniref:Uncharacterized protein n=1 Tax=Dryococelus australis TaxID=614101 RepID=A0ABQ9HFU2_9NEOP|nr:hypothetical protein PR048_014974 [Dryococelus australis]
MLKPIVSALVYLSELPGDNSKKASFILYSICAASFLTALVIAPKLLGITYNLSKYLQVTAVIQKLRNNAKNEFHELFVDVQQIASYLHVNIKVPRITDTQTHRPNPPSSTESETYYRTTAYIPCVNDIISSFTVRFLTHQEINHILTPFCYLCI